jgi:predicted tellurium resistance membrane protein TerC
MTDVIAWFVGLAVLLPGLLVAQYLLVRLTSRRSFLHIQAPLLVLIAALGSRLVTRAFGSPQWTYWALAVPLGALAAAMIIGSNLVANRRKRTESESER